MEYEEHLDRLYKTMQQSLKPEQKMVLKPPIISNMNKKTFWSNFREICEILGREEEHFMLFLEAEFSCNASIDMNGVMIIEGKYTSKNIETILRRYINDYIRCNSCKSVDTKFMKEDRINYLMCNNCRSQRKINSIQKGFQTTSKAIRKKSRD